MDNRQIDNFTERIADFSAVRFQFVFVHVLVREGQLGADQHDQPAQLQPDQKQGQGRETAVDGVIAGHAYLEKDISPLQDLKGRAGDYPADQSGREGDFGVGHEDIDKGE